MKGFEAVFLSRHPRGKKKYFAMTAKYTKKSKTFVEKYTNLFKKSKNFDYLPDRGSIGNV